MRDLGQKRSGHCSLEHKQCRSTIGTFTFTIQTKCLAEIGPASGLQFHDGMPVPVCHGVPSVEKSGTNLLIEYIGKVSPRRPEIGQDGNRIIVRLGDRGIHSPQAKFSCSGLLPQLHDSAPTHWVALKWAGHPSSGGPATLLRWKPLGRTSGAEFNTESSRLPCSSTNKTQKCKI